MRNVYKIVNIHNTPEYSMTKYNNYSGTYAKLSDDMKKVVKRICDTFNKKLCNDLRVTIIKERISLGPGDTFKRNSEISKDSWSKVGYRCFTGMWCSSCPAGVSNIINYYDKKSSCFCRKQFNFTDTCDVKEKLLYVWNSGEYYAMEDLKSRDYANVSTTFIYVEDIGNVSHSKLNDMYKYQKF